MPHLLKKKKIDVIFNLSVEKCPNTNGEEFLYESFNIPDKPTIEINSILVEINKKLDDYLLADKWILVHCYKGISRAPTVVISYLIMFKKFSLDEAFKFIRKKSEKIDPNAGFMMQLSRLNN